jgi:hypothetical protein
MIPLFLVRVVIYTAPFINTFGRLRAAGDNPGANLIGFIAGFTLFSDHFLRVPCRNRTNPLLADDDYRSASEQREHTPGMLRTSRCEWPQRRTSQIDDGAAERNFC